jgi:hypothetical protein
MVDRSSQPRWRCFIVAWQKISRLRITGEIHHEIREDNCARVSRAGTVRAGSLVITRSGLRCLRIAMTEAHVTDRIGDEIAGEHQQGKERQNAQKSFAKHELHCAERISEVCAKSTVALLQPGWTSGLPGQMRCHSCQFSCPAKIGSESLTSSLLRNLKSFENSSPARSTLKGYGGGSGSSP